MTNPLPDGERGSRFVGRAPSVVATCRQQGRHVLEYLTSCFEAEHRGQPIPSLSPIHKPKTKDA
jgi:transposase